MTEPWDWQEADLQALVAQKAEESVELEFKSCPALDISSSAAREKSKFDLSKDVSAFANSAGGTLVYGITEDPKTHTAEKLDAGYDPGEISHDWIGQVVNSSRIQPRIANVRIKPVQLNASSPGRVAYVVHVPQSSTAHQASDKRYYKRHNFESVPMEDYEVRDTMHRALQPRVSIRVEVDGETDGEAEFKELSNGDTETPEITFTACNEPGAAVAKYLQAQILSADNVTVDNGPGVQTKTRVLIPDAGYWTYHARSRVISPDHPLFSDEHRLLDGFRLRLPPGWREDASWPFLLWRVRSNDAAPAHGAFLFTRLLGRRWKFGPVAIDDLPEGYRAEFAP